MIWMLKWVKFKTQKRWLHIENASNGSFILEQFCTLYSKPVLKISSGCQVAEDN